MKLKAIYFSVILGSIFSIRSPAVSASTPIQEFTPKPSTASNSPFTYIYMQVARTVSLP